MVDRPTGTIAFLFTDVEGSTRLWEQQPDAMRDALAEHDRVLRAAIDRNGGYVFTTAGDSFAAAFDSTDAAAAAAVDAQLGLSEEAVQEGMSLRIRCGIHLGSADERDGDYFGRAPSLAARVMGAAHGGQILLSTAASAQLRRFDRVELGAIRLAGVESPELVSQLLAPGLEDSFDPPRAAAADSTIPAVPGPLYGRDKLVVRVIEDLTAGSRLLTLIGPGGVGKTRLALEVGHRATEWTAVVFTDLTPLSDEDQLVSTLAGLLGLRGDDQRPLRNRLLRELTQAPRLLILDNCEHLIDEAADFIDDLLQRGTNCQVIATSRELLDLPSERVVPVEPLETDNGEAALEFFVDLLTRAGRDPEELDSSVLQELCARVDGLPLALELAAARCATLDPNEVLAGLDETLSILARRRGRGGHHRSLEATLEWSWDLLEQDEREALASLSVFGSSWTLSSMAAVTDVSTARASDLLDRLLAKSLIVRRQDAIGATRTSMLETVRTYARLKAVEMDLFGPTADRHLRWVHDLTARATAEIRLVGSSSRALDELDAEVDEIRCALDRTVGSADAELGLVISTRLWEWWRSRMLQTSEGAHRIGELLATTNTDAQDRVGALAVMADLLMLSPDRAADAHEALREARELLAEIDDPQTVNQLTLRIISAAFDLDDPEVPRELERLAQAAERDRTTEDAMALHLQSLWTLGRGSIDEMVQLAPRTIAAAEKSGNPVSIAHGHEVTALAALRAGDHEGARPHLVTALDGLESTGQLGCALHAVESIAWWALASGKAEQGELLLSSALGLRRTFARNRTQFEEATIERILDHLDGLPAPDDAANLDATIDAARALLA